MKLNSSLETEMLVETWFPTVVKYLYKLNNQHSLVKDVIVLQEGGPLPGPETGLLSNTQK